MHKPVLKDISVIIEDPLSVVIKAMNCLKISRNPGTALSDIYTLGQPFFHEHGAVIILVLTPHSRSFAVIGSARNYVLYDKRTPAIAGAIMKVPASIRREPPYKW